MKEAWVSALTNLINTRKKELIMFNEERWLFERFNSVDKDGSGSLSFTELLKLLKQLNLEVSHEYAREIFEVGDFSLHYCLHTACEYLLSNLL